jgi:hypothetical protein
LCALFPFSSTQPPDVLIPTSEDNALFDDDAAADADTISLHSHLGPRPGPQTRTPAHAEAHVALGF